jgi:hypothetical protein
MSKQKSAAAVAEPEVKEPAALLPEVVTLEPEYTDVYHITRTLGPFTDGDAVWSSEKATEKLMEKFAEGYDLIDVETMGAWPQGGVYVLWLMGKPIGVPRKVSEIHHVVRTVSGLGSQGSITGFQADGYITSYINDGWRLFRDRVIPLGLSPAGVTLFWVLVR